MLLGHEGIIVTSCFLQYFLHICPTMVFSKPGSLSMQNAFFVVLVFLLTANIIVSQISFSSPISIVIGCLTLCIFAHFSVCNSLYSACRMFGQCFEGKGSPNA